MIKEEEIILKASRPFQIIFYGVFYSKKLLHHLASLPYPQRLCYRNGV